MTWEEVTCEDLEKTREQLVSVIARDLTIKERQFIVSVKEGMPQWDLIGLIEKKKTKSRIAPAVTYEKLMLEIAV
jgi:hypothetical protein